MQFLSSSQPLRATLILASFGNSQPFSNHVFNLDVKDDANAAKPKYDKPLRYGKLPEIHHIFKSDPKSGPVIISSFFVLAVAATVPVLLGAVSLPHLCCHYLPDSDHLLLVGLSRRKPKPSPESFLSCSHIPRFVLRINFVNGRTLLLILL